MRPSVSLGASSGWDWFARVGSCAASEGVGFLTGFFEVGMEMGTGRRRDMIEAERSSVDCDGRFRLARGLSFELPLALPFSIAVIGASGRLIGLPYIMKSSASLFNLSYDACVRGSL